MDSKMGVGERKGKGFQAAVKGVMAVKDEPKQGLAQDHQAVSVQPEHSKHQQRKGQHRGAAITDKWQGNTNHRYKPDGHADINCDLDKKQPGHAIGKISGEGGTLSLGEQDGSNQKTQIGQQEEETSQEPKLFSNSAKDEVGLLFWDMAIAGKRALQEPFSG